MRVGKRASERSQQTWQEFSHCLLREINAHEKVAKFFILAFVFLKQARFTCNFFSTDPFFRFLIFGANKFVIGMSINVQRVIHGSFH